MMHLVKLLAPLCLAQVSLLGLVSGWVIHAHCLSLSCTCQCSSPSIHAPAFHTASIVCIGGNVRMLEIVLPGKVA